MDEPMETPASTEELKRSNKKRFYRLLEVEYVEGPETSLRRLARNYNISLQGLYKYAKRHDWKKKRAERAKTMTERKVDQPDPRAAFQNFAVSQLQGLAWRANVVLNKERKEVIEDKRTDTVGDIVERNQMLQGVIALGTIIYGPPEPPEQPDTIFETLIVEQKCTYQRVTKVPTEPEPIVVEIPEGYTVTDVTGRPAEET